MQQKISRRDFLKFLGINNHRSALFDGVTTVPAFTGNTENKPPTFALGELKLVKAKETPSVCSSCGVDCGIIVFSDKAGMVLNIQRDPDYLNNQEPICCAENCPQKMREHLAEQSEIQSADTAK